MNKAYLFILIIFIVTGCDNYKKIKEVEKNAIKFTDSIHKLPKKHLSESTKNISLINLGGKETDSFFTERKLENVKFTGSNNNTLEFVHVNFDKYIIFNHYKPAQMNMIDCEFFDDANFIDTEIPSLNIMQCKFYKDIFINWFNGSAHFSMCEFRGNMKMKISPVDSIYIYFNNCVLPDTIDLSFNSNIKNEINFTDASFIDSLHYNKYTDKYFRPHLVNLYGSDVSKIKMDYTHFKLLILDSINLNPKRFIPSDETSSLYESLLKNFKDSGQLESYKLLDIEYQKYKWKNSRLSFLGIMPDLWWKFGYDKDRIFYWMIGFIILYTLMTLTMFRYLNSIYQLESLNIRDYQPGKRFFFRRLWYSFVYTSTIFFLLTIKVDKINYKKVRGTIYIMIVYSTGIICLAYIANYIIQK